MGSGDKFEIGRNGGFGFGIIMSRFPHQLSINITLGLWYVYIGFGRGYDE